mmetsp:Transcript_6638/g.19632  ORF Transcript_6638/g.19632 Transcript_6638/m.19632 type:complete len:88 (+) Transcript_6638:1433-1696(+)
MDGTSEGDRSSREIDGGGERSWSVPPPSPSPPPHEAEAKFRSSRGEDGSGDDNAARDGNDTLGEEAAATTGAKAPPPRRTERRSESE